MVGNVSSAAVIWESFGTETTPSIGDLIKGCSYKDGFIYFETAATFKEGNALIAAKDADDNILWSWHIWLTDQPQDQVYYNDAGIVMDRNLGATSASIGDIGALGLLYQWGRKDPFLINNVMIKTSSTTTWYSEDSTEGTSINMSISHPTTSINNWTPTENSWTTLNTFKSIYDPCPTGYRIPDNIWHKATKEEKFNYTFDDSNKGMNFSLKFGKDLIIWYPATFKSINTYEYEDNYIGNYWFASSAYSCNSFRFGEWYEDGSWKRRAELTTSEANSRKSVRCIRE